MYTVLKEDVLVIKHVRNAVISNGTVMQIEVCIDYNRDMKRLKQDIEVENDSKQ